MYHIADSITFRVDAETRRVLRNLTKHTSGTTSEVIKEALQARWESIEKNSRPSAWEVYSKLDIPPPRGPKHDRARNAKKLIREMVLAKQRSDIPT